MTHDESEIESTGVNQETLQDIRVAAQVRTTHAARVIEMRKGAFDPFAALPHQAAPAMDLALQRAQGHSQLGGRRPVGTPVQDVFAQGALEAAVWVAKKKPGLYDMLDLLGLR